MITNLRMELVLLLPCQGVTTPRRATGTSRAAPSAAPPATTSAAGCRWTSVASARSVLVHLYFAFSSRCILKVYLDHHPFSILAFSHSSEGDHQQARAEDGQQGGRGGLPVRHLPTQPLARPGLRARRRYAEKISCGMRKYLLSVHADSCGLAGGTPWGGNVPEWGEYVNTTNARSDTWQ